MERQVEEQVKTLGATVHERIVMMALIACGLFLPIIIPFAHLGVAPMVLLMGLVAATRIEPWRRGAPHFYLRPDFSDPLVLSALAGTALTLWIAVAGLWAPRGDAPLFALNIATPVLAGGVVIWDVLRRPARETQLFARVFASAMAAAILLLAFEAATGGLLRALTPPADPSPGRVRDWIALGRGATAAAVLLFPAVLLVYAVTRRRALGAVLFAAALFSAIRFDVTSNVVAIIVAAIVFSLGLVQPQRAIGGMRATILVAILFAPAAAFLPTDAILSSEAGTLPASWLQRFVIWREGARAAIECLPFGCGPDYARVIGDTIDKVVIPGESAPLSVMPVHPHSLFLQLWLELGIPGVLLFAAAIYFAGRAALAAPLSAPEKAAIAASALALLVSALVEMSVWQVWRVATPVLGGVFIALAYKRRVADDAAAAREPA